MSDLENPIFTNPDKARKWLEQVRWPGGPFCPHCGDTENWHRMTGKSHRSGLFQCNSCRKQFSVTVGTVFERSKVPLHKWLLASYLLSSSKKGISSHQIHRMLGVTYKTAWFMTHRIREAMRDDDPAPLGGTGKIVEADETFIGTKTYKFTQEGWKRKTGTAGKYAIVSMVERGGNVRSVTVSKVNARIVRDVLVRTANRNSTLSTDEAPYYKRVGREFADHVSVTHSDGQYVDGIAHTNTLEGYFSIFKRGMKGVYQHCGEKHLQRYVTEFDFRYNHREMTDFARAAHALNGISGKRLTYRRTSERPTA